MDTRIIRRLAYDGNYQRAIEMLLDIVEKQETNVKSLNEQIDILQNQLDNLQQ